MPAMVWVIGGAGLVSLWLYKQSKNPTSRLWSLFAGEDDDNDEV